MSMRPTKKVPFTGSSTQSIAKQKEKQKQKQDTMLPKEKKKITMMNIIIAPSVVSTVVLIKVRLQNVQSNKNKN